MMMVRCYLGPSKIEGLGVFAKQDIRKGEIAWRFDPRFDQVISIDDVDAAPAHIREFLERYAYIHHLDAAKLILDADESRFMNHADTPNLDFSDPDIGVALRDIPAGEELTCDYACFTIGPVVFQPPRHAVNGHPALDAPATGDIAR